MIRKRLLLMLLIFVVTPVAQSSEKIDYVNLGATLLKDGYLQRAKSVLEKVDVAKEGFNFSQYYALKGILLHKLSYPMLSNLFFNESIIQSSPEEDKKSVILIYIAKNYWQLQGYARVVSSLNLAGDAALKSPQLFVIKAESYKKQNKISDAWAVLDQGLVLYPDFAQFYSQKFYYLLELGLYQQAVEYAEKYVKLKLYSAKDYLAMAYALRESKQYEKASILLEEAVAKHTNDEKLIELLGQVYIEQKKYLMAALVFDWAAMKQPKFSKMAAMLYLRAHQPIRSMQLNRRILNQSDKFRQRLSIDIYMEDYEALIAKVPALKRYDLLKDDKIAYAVGYGNFVIGDYENAKKYLKKIKDNALFGKASQIFQKIEKCQNDPIDCY